jgi:hypothetical protein
VKPERDSRFRGNDGKNLNIEYNLLNGGTRHESRQKVSVKRISLVDDFYGIIVELRQGRKKYDTPLCELAATNEQSPNAQLIQDYRVWFANR